LGEARKQAGFFLDTVFSVDGNRIIF